MKSICRKTLEIRGTNIISVKYDFINRFNILKTAIERARAPILDCKFFIVSSVGELNEETKSFSVIEELSREEVDISFLAAKCGLLESEFIFG